MVIYLPESTQPLSIEALPPSTLKEQFTATLNVLEHLAGRREGLAFHPCVAMWRPYPLHALFHARLLSEQLDNLQIPYGKDMAAAILTLNERIPRSFAYSDPKFNDPSHDVKTPPHFMADTRMRSSHRSRLLTNFHSDPHLKAWAQEHNWNEPQHLSLHWPEPLPDPNAKAVHMAIRPPATIATTPNSPQKSPTPRPEAL